MLHCTVLSRTDQSSDGFTINDVVDINGQHYCNFFHVRVIKANAISWPWTKDSFFFFLNISVETTFSQKPLDQLKATFMCSFLKNTNKPKFV